MQKIKFFLIIVALAFSPLSLAQDASDDNAFLAEEPEVPMAKNKKKLGVSFENELIKEGGATPSVDYIFSRSQFNFKKMIKFREDFIPEATRGKGEFNGSY